MVEKKKRKLKCDVRVANNRPIDIRNQRKEKKARMKKRKV